MSGGSQPIYQPRYRAVLPRHGARDLHAIAFIELARDRTCGRPIQRTPRHGRGFYPVYFIGRFRESGQQRSNDVDPFRIVEPMAPTWIRAAL
jgi:hypothetical protein